MIHSYKIKNFLSFAEETEVSFLLPKATPKNNLSMASLANSSLRVSKVITVLGPNASGKTNLLKGLAFLGWFITKSFIFIQPDAALPIKPHFANANKPIKFEMEFEFDNQLFRYELWITTERVLVENLKRKTSTKFSYIFERKWLAKEKCYEIKQQDFSLQQQEAEKVRPNASLIATAAQYQVPLAMKLLEKFSKFFTNVSSTGRVSFDTTQLFSAAYLYEKNNKLKKQMVNLIKKMDLGLTDIEIMKQIAPSSLGASRPYLTENTTYIPYGVHQIDTKTYKLDFLEESGGTRSAFILLYHLLSALEAGGVAIIDELEADLHPQLLEYMLDLFFNPGTNPKDAQIIFTCHSHEVMNLLDKTQIILVEKNEKCESEAWRLDEMEGVRRDENLYAKYRAGVYGAVPNLR